VTLTQRHVFETEIRQDVRYERFIVVKVGIALAIVAAVIIARVLFSG
jgi:hypothetical protein